MPPKETAKKTAEKAHAAHPAKKYIEGIGRRKTAIARVRIAKGKQAVSVNRKEFAAYFPAATLREVAQEPIKKLNLEETFEISASVSGGGIHAQAEAVRHGLARALVLHDPELKKRLHKFGFLTRDPRMVERKKYGLKKARRAPQWAKR